MSGFPSFISDPPPHHYFHDAHNKHTEHPSSSSPPTLNDLHVSRPKIVTGIPTVPVTMERRPFVPMDGHEGRGLKHPGVARANIAPSYENPHGTTKDNYANAHQHQTVLRQHCAFFDRDKDNVIWPIDTYVGFRRLGTNVLLSLFAMFIIHINFSYPTAPSYLPDLYFRIWLDRVHKTKHGSDTDTYDSEGRFLPQKFEDFFEKFSSVYPDHSALGAKGEIRSVGGDGGPDQRPSPESRHTKKGLTYMDVLRGWKAQRRLLDPIGISAEFLEWSATYYLLWPEDGVMRKEDVRRVYDGSVFWDIAEKRAKENAKKKGIKNGMSKELEQLQREKKAEFVGDKVMLEEIKRGNVSVQ